MWKLSRADSRKEPDMDIFDKLIASLVFKRKNRMDFDRISMDTHMLRVLLELDGSRSMKRICDKLDMEMSVLRLTVDKLYHLGMVEMVPGSALNRKQTSPRKVGNWRGARVELD